MIRTPFRAITASLVLAVGCGPALAADEQPVPDSLTDFVTKGKVGAVVKTLYFERDFENDTTDWSSLAIGGNLNYETAGLYGFSLGLGAKTSQGDLLDSDDEVYRDLLAMGDDPGDDESYAAMDEYFLRYRNWDTTVTLGAQALATPWMEGFDIRMTPKKYRGLAVNNQGLGSLALQALYITDWLDWVEEDWQSVTAAITGNEQDEEGVIAGGAIWQATPDVKFQVWDYYFNEVMNEFYVRADFSRKFGGEVTFAANLRYLDQKDEGDMLAGEIDTYQAGGVVSGGGFGALLTGYYGENGDDAIEAPFGGDKLVIMQVFSLSRAEEEFWGIKADYDFGRIGVEGLTAYVIYGEFNTPDSGTNVSPDIEELDFSIQYGLRGWFENCSIRFRYAIVNQDEGVEGGKDWTDARLYLQYRF